jgi:hypothetical protein
MLIKIYLLIKGLIILFWTYGKIQKKPFKFEDFKTKEEAQAYFDRHYPIGSNIDELLNDLEKVGVRYSESSKKMLSQGIQDGEESLEYDKVYIGKYRNNWISWHPLGCYNLSIYLLSNGSIVSIVVSKSRKFL